MMMQLARGIVCHTGWWIVKCSYRCWSGQYTLLYFLELLTILTTTTTTIVIIKIKC